MIVRAASEADKQILVHLNDAVQSLHAALYPEDFKPAVDPAEGQGFFASLLASDEHLLAIAEVGGTPVGYLWLERRARAATPFKLASRQLLVHHIVVLEGARRAGVGTALFRWAEEESKRFHADEVALDTWAANVAAHEFFRRLGFEPYRMMMRRPAQDSPAHAQI